MRREFLQLADTFNPAKHKIAGYLVSEKLDGTRCFWDGGLSRGLPTEQVPWASITDPKTGKRKSKLKPLATGLWSRYGNPIMAPDEFLNALPACPLDGELWAGRGNFQLCRSICAGDEPDPRFHQITYAVYSAPAIPYVFGTGEIKNTNMVCNLNFEEVEKWIKPRLLPGYGWVQVPATFNDELMFLREYLEVQNDRVFVHKQTRLPENEEEARAVVDEFLKKVLDQGGEGCVIRNPLASWTPKRHKGLLKFKPFEDAEGTITGFTGGRETTKGSRLLGKIGALIVEFNGKRLELAGLTDAERDFGNGTMSDWAALHPGLDVPPDVGVNSKHFKKGQTVTFKYRELTDDGIPKEARYWRRRDVE
jgi:DNA ligase-1